MPTAFLFLLLLLRLVPDADVQLPLVLSVSPSLASQRAQYLASQPLESPLAVVISMLHPVDESSPPSVGLQSIDTSPQFAEDLFAKTALLECASSAATRFLRVPVAVLLELAPNSSVVPSAL